MKIKLTEEDIISEIVRNYTNNVDLFVKIIDNSTNDYKKIMETIIHLFPLLHDKKMKLKTIFYILEKILEE